MRVETVVAQQCNHTLLEVIYSRLTQPETFCGDEWRPFTRCFLLKHSTTLSKCSLTRCGVASVATRLPCEGPLRTNSNLLPQGFPSSAARKRYDEERWVRARDAATRMADTTASSIQDHRGGWDDPKERTQDAFETNVISLHRAHKCLKRT